MCQGVGPEGSAFLRSNHKGSSNSRLKDEEQPLLAYRCVFKMGGLKLQHRLAASILGIGKRRVWYVMTLMQQPLRRRRVDNTRGGTRGRCDISRRARRHTTALVL